MSTKPLKPLATKKNNEQFEKIREMILKRIHSGDEELGMAYNQAVLLKRKDKRVELLRLGSIVAQKQLAELLEKKKVLEEKIKTHEL